MSSAPFDGKRFARRLKGLPGVYRMLDADGDVLYVGKARDLRKRVGSYFTRTVPNQRMAAMLEQVAGIEVSVTGTEGEALLLENQLIKAHKPRYNVLLRDDKSYPYVLLTSDHRSPRLAFHRGPQKIPGEYFGPFPSAYAVRDSLSQMQKLFKVRQCEDSYFENRSRPCLQYQIARCTAPCVGLVSDEDYANQVQLARMFLEGNSQRVIEQLGRSMEEAAGELEFERAAELRDRIATLKRVQSKQFVEGARGDVDVIGCVYDGGAACVQVVFIRGGRNLGHRSYFPRVPKNSDSGEILGAFISQHYTRRAPPADILVSHEVPERAEMAELLSELAGHKVKIVARPRGERARWLQMAVTNAELALANHHASHAGMRRRLQALTDLLDLDEPPTRMECFDISHTRGEATGAACVVFDQNGPVKSDYRRFNISGVTPGDDYGALRQALERRYRRLANGEGATPDLLFIDGGKGQLGVAKDVLSQHAVEGVRIIGVAKGPGRKAGHEELILDDGTVRRPGPDHPASHLVQNIRDEAHRFAVTGHRQRRGKARRRSTLEDIAGVGPGRRRALLKYFGGLQGLRRAGVEDIADIPGISAALATRIYDHLHH